MEAACAPCIEAAQSIPFTATRLHPLHGSQDDARVNQAIAAEHARHAGDWACSGNAAHVVHRQRNAQPASLLLMPSNTPTSTLALIAIQPLDKINTSHDGNGAAAAGRAGFAAHSGRLAVLQCLGVDHGALQKAAGACRQPRGRVGGTTFNRSLCPSPARSHSSSASSPCGSFSLGATGRWLRPCWRAWGCSARLCSRWAASWCRASCASECVTPWQCDQHAARRLAAAAVQAGAVPSAHRHACHALP